jgi:phospholipid/cholesterol/gamma-HCH transport system substrate-binding protein
VPDDGTAHLGLALNIFDPLPCTKGYEATPRRAGNQVADTSANRQAFCAEPQGSPVDVRGSQNVPRAGRPGGAAGLRQSGADPVPGITLTLKSSLIPMGSVAQILLP